MPSEILKTECKKEEETHIEKMHNGHSSFVLVESADWGDFDSFAEYFCNSYSFNVLGKADSVDARLRNIEKDGVKVRIAWDDYMYAICLESDTEDGDILIRKIAEEWDAKKWNNSLQNFATVDKLNFHYIIIIILIWFFIRYYLL